MLVHLAHILDHSVSVLLIGTDQRTNALRINIWVGSHAVDLPEVVLRARHVHGSWIDELRWALHPLLDAALMTLVWRKPLVLRRPSALLLAMEAASLFLFLVVSVLIR